MNSSNDANENKLDWARRWASENIWKVRKRPRVGPFV